MRFSQRRHTSIPDRIQANRLGIRCQVIIRIPVCYPTSPPKPPKPKPKPKPKPPKPRPVPGVTKLRGGKLGNTGGNWVVFAPDRLGRATHARATVTRAGVRRRRAAEREGRPQVKVKRASRRCGTDRGHLIGRILGGPGRDALNFVPLPTGFNRGKMAGFEKRIAAAADRGYVLKVGTRVFYKGDSRVPARVRMTVTTVSAPPGSPPFNPVFDERVPPRVGKRPKGCDW